MLAKASSVLFYREIRNQIVYEYVRLFIIVLIAKLYFIYETNFIIKFEPIIFIISFTKHFAILFVPTSCLFYIPNLLPHGFSIRINYRLDGSNNGNLVTEMIPRSIIG